MNLKWISKIFGASPPLSRKDITNYGDNPDSVMQQDIEAKEASSSFEADAMEGWEAMNYDVGVMRNLDKKFIGKSNLGWYIGGSIVVAAAIVTLFFWDLSATNDDSQEIEPKEKITALLDDQELTLEQSDIVLPDSISEMVAVPQELQIEPEVIQKEFKQMKSEYKEKVPPRIEMIALDEIRIPIKSAKPEIIQEHKTAAELYLFDLKLIDYRKYRSRPTVKTKSVVLTGTPANIGDENSTETTSEMQEIEIPYIEYLSKTMRKFSRGSFKSALSRFDIILETYNDDVNANFYSGMCLYNLGEHEAAIDRFLACRLSVYSNFDEEAQWMTALSYEELGQDDKAFKYFKQIVEQGGFYKKRAQAKMK